MRTRALTHEFVEAIPDELAAGVLYVSVSFATAAHLCFCGCSNEVITPLGPTDWSLTYDGESISLTPSIGNWSFDCRSHYWIRRDRVEWARDWTKAQVDRGRERDRAAKAWHYQERKDGSVTPEPAPAPAAGSSTGETLTAKIRRWLYL